MPRRNPFKSKILLYVALTVAGVAAAGGGIFTPGTTTVAGTTTTTSTGGTTTVVGNPGCKVSNTEAQNLVGCPASVGLDLRINENDANKMTSGSVVNCTQNILTMAQNYAKGVAGVDYTKTGSGYPVRIQIDYAPGQTTGLIGFVVGNNCSGNPTDPDAVDAILCSEGNGRGTGTVNDAMKIAGNFGTNGIRITQAGCTDMVGGVGGTTPGIQCGGGTNHIDNIQFQGAVNVWLVDAVAGDFHGGYATCPGAGGGIFFSLFNTNGYCHNCHIIRGHVDACNKGFNAHNDGSVDGTLSTGSVVGLVSRSGNPADYTASSEPCSIGIAPHVFDNMVAFNYAAGLAAVHAVLPSWTPFTATGDQWCTIADACGWVGFNPANDW